MDIMVSESHFSKLYYPLLFLIGYTLGPVIGSESNFTAPNSTYSATNLSCPIFSEYDNCNYTTFNGNCDSRGGPILLTCFRGKYTYNE